VPIGRSERVRQSAIVVAARSSVTDFGRRVRGLRVVFCVTLVGLTWSALAGLLVVGGCLEAADD
jgi:hypothetical protein